MIATLAVILVGQASAQIAKVGYQAPDGKFMVLEGRNRRSATFRERRLLQAESPLPVHPKGLYRLIRVDAETPDNGLVKGVKVLDRAGRPAANTKWLLGEFTQALNVRLDVVGWGQSPHEIVVGRFSGSPSAGLFAEFACLNLKTRRLSKRVILSAGSGMGLVVGNVALPGSHYSRGSSNAPPLYRLAAGKPVRLRYSGRPAVGVPMAIAPEGRWALLWIDQSPVLADLATGAVQAVPGNEARFLP